MSIKELNEFMKDHGFCNTDNEEDLPKKYVCDLVESALREGRNKAINEFAEKFIFKAVCEGCSGCCNCYEEGRQSECEDWKAYMKIAEEMRGAE